MSKLATKSSLLTAGFIFGLASFSVFMFVYGEMQTTTHLVTESEVRLEPPEWATGDWFAITVSQWRGFAVPARPETLPWEPAEDEILRVSSKEHRYGHVCYRVEKQYHGTKETSEAFYFRAADFAAIEFDLIVPPGSRAGRTMLQVQAPRPFLNLHNSVLFPVFPLVAGQLMEWSTKQHLQDADGKTVGLDETINRTYCTSPGVVRQVVSLEQVAQMGSNDGLLRIELTDGSQLKGIIRWVPGNPWWVQAWSFTRSGDTLRSWRRAALAATSTDVVPDEETARILPTELAGWRQASLRTADLTASLWHVLSKYRKMQEVTYANDAGDKLIFWVFPSLFDEECVEAYEKMRPREREKKGLPELFAKGANYRVFAVHIPKVADWKSVKNALKQAVQNRPAVTLEEYPLPKAAPGGKTLED